MADEWKSWAFRQKISNQLEEICRQNPSANQHGVRELESQAFQRSTSREEYMQCIGRVAGFLREAGQQTNQQNSNPNLTAVLSGPQAQGGQMTGPVGQMAGPGGQMGGPGSQMTGPGGQIMPSGQMGPMGQRTGPGGQMPGGPVVTGPNTNTIMPGQPSNLQGPRMGQPMPPNIPTQAPDIGNWSTNRNPRLSEIQISNNKKQPSISINQLGSQQGKLNSIQMTVGGPGGAASQIGQVTGQMVPSMNLGRGTTMQPRVPSPGFAGGVIPRQGTPTSTSASPAPPLSSATSQPSPAFVSPSPTSSMVPSPAGGATAVGMARAQGHLGAPSPSGMLNTPGQAQQPSPAAQSMASSQVEDAVYREEVRQLSKYVEPLRHMIARIGNEDAEKSRKMKHLYDLLQNPQRRMPLETLLKCKQVLEKLNIRDPEVGPTVPPSVENRITALSEAVTNCVMSPCASHTLHRTISPALSVLLGPDLVSRPTKHIKRDNPLQLPPETPNISDIIQGEVARLNSRFRVNLDCQQPPGSDDLTLICQLDDPNLPCVPPISLTVPANYPEKPPRCDLLAVDYETTDFLKNIRESMMGRLRNMPPHCSLTMVLHSWEMSVRQACAPKSCIESAVASAMALSFGI